MTGKGDQAGRENRLVTVNVDVLLRKKMVERRALAEVEMAIVSGMRTKGILKVVIEAVCLCRLVCERLWTM